MLNWNANSNDCQLWKMQSDTWGELLDCENIVRTVDVPFKLLKQCGTKPTEKENLKAGLLADQRSREISATHRNKRSLCWWREGLTRCSAFSLYVAAAQLYICLLKAVEEKDKIIYNGVEKQDTTKGKEIPAEGWVIGIISSITVYLIMCCNISTYYDAAQFYWSSIDCNQIQCEWLFLANLILDLIFSKLIYFITRMRKCNIKVSILVVSLVSLYQFKALFFYSFTQLVSSAFGSFLVQLRDSC